jgi:gamma-glutamyltranspeptidase / glutathione hydrolase
MSISKRLLPFFLILICLLKVRAQEPVYAKHGMVVSSSQLASDVGRDVLKDGGNAIDAAIATAFALATTWPAAGNIGGGGFIVYRNHNGTVTTFDFREKAPKASTQDMYLDKSGKLVPDLNHKGILAVGVPGTVAGLYMAHQKYGKLPWSRLVTPAIRLAKKGIAITYALYDDAQSLSETWKQYPSTARVMFKESKDYYLPGETWRQPDLAKTLKRIRVNGKDGFYRGEIAEKLVAFMKSMGGIISLEDLADYKAVERAPVKGSYRGYDIYSMPPPSSGGITLIQMLNILEGFDLKALGYHSADYVHVVCEAMRRAYANRAYYLGDPAFNQEIPTEKLISKEYAEHLRNSIRLDLHSVSDSSVFSQMYESPNTTHLSVLDEEGNAVSMTYTLEYIYGSQIIADGLGFFLNNEMGDFNPWPGVTDSQGLIGTPPNLIAPGKRMLSSMTPTIVTKDNKPFLIIGSPGGRTIINTVLQVILNVIDYKMNIAESIDQKRFHHQWLPDRIFVEPFCLTMDTKKRLTEKGHILEERHGAQGAVMGILYDAPRNRISGHADSRAPDGGVAGY